MEIVGSRIERDLNKDHAHVRSYRRDEVVIFGSEMYAVEWLEHDVIRLL